MLVVLGFLAVLVVWTILIELALYLLGRFHEWCVDVDPKFRKMLKKTFVMLVFFLFCLVYIMTRRTDAQRGSDPAAL